MPQFNYDANKKSPSRKQTRKALNKAKAARPGRYPPNSHSDFAMKR